MTLQTVLAALRAGPSIFESLLAAAPPAALGFREAPGTWTCAEVLAHVADAEATLFMPRVKRILADGGRFTPFDREGGFARYASWTPIAIVGEFAQLRRANVQDLASLRLTDADLARPGVHPEFGRVTLGELLSTWATHDLAHANQFTRVVARAASADVGPWARNFSLLRDR